MDFNVNVTEYVILVCESSLDGFTQIIHLVEAGLLIKSDVI